MIDAAARTTNRDSTPADRRRVVLSDSEWMRWNDVALSTHTLPPPFDLDQPVDPSPTAETSGEETEAS